MTPSIAEAFVKFNVLLHQKLIAVETIDIHNLRTMLSLIRGEVLQALNSEGDLKRDIRNGLNSWIEYTYSTAETLRNSPTVKSRHLLKELFKGSKLKTIEPSYFVLEDEEGNGHFNTIVDNVDESTIMSVSKRIIAQDLEDSIVDEVFFDRTTGKQKVVDLDDALLRQLARGSETTPESPQIKSLPEPIIEEAKPIAIPPKIENPTEKNKEIYIGRITTRNRQKVLVNSHGQFIEGFFKSDVEGLRIVAGDFFIAEKGNAKLVLTVEKFEFSEQSICGQEISFTEMRSPATFKVIHRVDYDENGKIVSDGSILREDYSDFMIRRPKAGDSAILNIPSEGTQIGVLDTGEDNSLPLYLAPEKEYQHIFVSGVMGSGKTNLLIYLAASFASRAIPPAVVIFDVEKDYLRLGNALPQEIEEELLKRKINLGFPFCLDIKTISTGPSNNATIPLVEIQDLDIPALVPELPPASEDTFISLAKSALAEQRSQGIPTMQNLLERIKDKARYQITNIHMRSAVLRACNSTSFEIFDQPDTAPIQAQDLCRPGKITIIDISELHPLQRRTAILATLTMLNSYKDTMENRDKSVMVFIDEAHQLFPAVRTGQLKKNQIERIWAKLDYISHQGRKRKYGIILATQSLNDINPEVASLCNTQIILSNSGRIPEWLRCRMNDIATKEINNMKTGTAYIVFPGSRQPQRIRIPRVMR